MADLSQIPVILAPLFLPDQRISLRQTPDMSADIRKRSVHLVSLIEKRRLDVRQNTSQIKRKFVMF